MVREAPDPRWLGSAGLGPGGLGSNGLAPGGLAPRHLVDERPGERVAPPAPGLLDLAATEEAGRAGGRGHERPSVWASEARMSVSDWMFRIR